MGEEKLFILIEGNDDERFFKRIILPLFNSRYRYIKLWQHAQRSKEDIKKLISGIKELENDYLYIEDLDEVKAVANKKSIIKERIDFIDYNRIVIVVKEIEGWYLAGLDRKTSDYLQIPYFESTDDIYKEDFNEIIPHNFLSRIAFMQEILNNFSVEMAVNKNKSFKYFINNLVTGGQENKLQKSFKS